MTATSEQIAAMLGYAAQAGDLEACGVVLDSGRVYPCRNLADEPARQFRVDPVDRAAAERLGRVVGIWHSHPNAPDDPSLADRACASARGCLGLGDIISVSSLFWMCLLGFAMLAGILLQG